MIWALAFGLGLFPTMSMAMAIMISSSPAQINHLMAFGSSKISRAVPAKTNSLYLSPPVNLAPPCTMSCPVILMANYGFYRQAMNTKTSPPSALQSALHSPSLRNFMNTRANNPKGQSSAITNGVMLTSMVMANSILFQELKIGRSMAGIMPSTIKANGPMGHCMVLFICTAIREQMIRLRMKNP